MLQKILLALTIPLFVTTLPSFGQTAGPDVLIFANGEKLVGSLVRVSGGSVVFKSEMVGEVTVNWSKIQELRSSKTFAAISSNVKLRNAQDTGSVPQGSVVMTGKDIQISGGGAPQTLASGTVSNVVDEASFKRALHQPKFSEGWAGGATFGLSLAESTQKNETFTAAVNLVRGVPSEGWLPLKSRTIVGFNEAFSQTTQDKVPTAKTSLFHAGIEQDWYLSPRLFAFGAAAFDHSFSQGLYLQQSYNGGLGFVAYKKPNQELDLKASFGYTHQAFGDVTTVLANGKTLVVTPPSNSLFGMTFGDTYNRKFAHGVLFNQFLSVTPSFNKPSAYSAVLGAGVTFPVYHRFGLTLAALDNFLNNPPSGFKKNSFVFSAGATYSFK